VLQCVQCSVIVAECAVQCVVMCVAACVAVWATHLLQVVAAYIPVACCSTCCRFLKIYVVVRVAVHVVVRVAVHVAVRVSVRVAVRVTAYYSVLQSVL